MKSGKIVKYGMGLILFDCCYLLIEAFVDIRTGRMTTSEWLTLITLSITTAILIVALMKKGKRITTRNR